MPASIDFLKKTSSYGAGENIALSCLRRGLLCSGLNENTEKTVQTFPPSRFMGLARIEVVQCSEGRSVPDPLLAKVHFSVNKK